MGTLAATKDQQSWRMTGISCNGEELRPYRNADDTGVAEEMFCLLEMDSGGGDALAHNLVGKAGHIVRFKSQGGNASENGGCHGGAGGVSAHANNNIRPELADDLARMQDGERQVE